jgi:hypothetical protein
MKAGHGCGSRKLGSGEKYSSNVIMVIGPCLGKARPFAGKAPTAAESVNCGDLWNCLGYDLAIREHAVTLRGCLVAGWSVEVSFSRSRLRQMGSPVCAGLPLSFLVSRPVIILLL